METPTEQQEQSRPLEDRSIDRDDDSESGFDGDDEGRGSSSSSSVEDEGSSYEHGDVRINTTRRLHPVEHPTRDQHRENSSGAPGDNRPNPLKPAGARALRRVPGNLEEVLTEQRRLVTGLGIGLAVPEAMHEHDDDSEDHGQVYISREDIHSRPRFRRGAFGQSDLQQRMVGSAAQHTSQSEGIGRPDTDEYFGDDDDDDDSDALGSGSDDWSTQATAGEDRDEVTLPIRSRPLPRPPPAEYNGQ